MKKDRDSQERNGHTLRQRAQQALEKQRNKKEAIEGKMTPAEVQRLVQELQIHQIELQMQNEELRRTRDEAETERERFLDLYDFAPVAYLTMDNKGAIQQVNLAGARLLGMERSRLIGNSFSRFVYDTDIGVFTTFLKKVFTDEKKVNCSVSIGREISKLIHVQMEATLTGDKQQCRAAVMDVTERKNAEDSLRKLQEELEERVIERTLQLAESVKELESFNYSVSHDLKAPLRAIDGYIRMILRGHGDQFDEDTRKKFNAVRQNTHKMGQLIEHLLVFSRLGEKHLAKIEVDMNAVVNEVWESLKSIYCDRAMNLKCDILPCAMGDRTLINQIITNILINSIKYAKTGDEVSIEIGTHQSENETVYFIRDSGIGFNMAYYDKLFGLFQRLHSPEKFDGMGIGLAIVKRIIKMHGGRIWAKSKENEGATFYFTLPSSPAT